MSQINVDHSVVIVGASLAGTRFAEGLRAAGHQGDITLIGAETELPYDRPPLSKDLLKSDWSESAVEEVRLATQESLENANIRVQLGVRATAVDLAQNTVSASDGNAYGYDALVIATGAAARPSPWKPESGVFQLRTLDDSRQLAGRLTSGKRVVIVGGGFIGTEIAAAAVGFGCTVTVVDPVAEPMARIVGPEISGDLVGLHRKHGAKALFGVGVNGITGSEGDLTVHLDGGVELVADIAVVGIGTIAGVDWLEGSGLTLDNGVVTDEFLRCAGAANVFAIGDVAKWPHPGRGMAVRAEHWTNASDQARYLASAFAKGATDPYSSTDYVWSDQYDWKVHSIGWRDADGHSALVGDLQQDEKVAVVHLSAGGDVTGVVTVNWVRALNVSRRKLMAGTTAAELTAAIQELV